MQLLQTRSKVRETGIRGETYAYWYLRRHGYVFIARNFMPRFTKGELDLVGYNGPTLAFVEVRHPRSHRPPFSCRAPRSRVSSQVRRARR